MYTRGVGLHRDGTKVEVDTIKASLQTVGSVVMATSVAWGGLGYLTSPSYSFGPEGEKVVSLELPATTIAAKSFSYVAKGNENSKSLKDAKYLRELFAIAYEKAEKQDPIVTINNQPTNLDVKDVSLWKSDSKQVYLVNYVNAGNSRVALTYDAKIKKGEVIFYPANISVLEGSSDAGHEGINLLK